MGSIASHSRTVRASNGTTERGLVLHNEEKNMYSNITRRPLTATSRWRAVRYSRIGAVVTPTMLKTSALSVTTAPKEQSLR